nr:hypothetical protein [uncultured Devosia sp.]
MEGIIAILSALKGQSGGVVLAWLHHRHAGTPVIFGLLEMVIVGRERDTATA